MPGQTRFRQDAAPLSGLRPVASEPQAHERVHRLECDTLDAEFLHGASCTWAVPTWPT